MSYKNTRPYIVYGKDKEELVQKMFFVMRDFGAKESVVDVQYFFPNNAACFTIIVTEEQKE